MQQIAIGHRVFSKALCGTNPFWGRSHFSEARNQEYLNRFDDETIERAIQRCLSLGVNTVESSANERILSILSRLQGSWPDPVLFVGSTRIDQTSAMKSHQQKLSYLIENKTDVCVIHSQFVDRPGTGDTIGGLDRMIDRIHEAGLLAGISTHRVRTVERCENYGYGIDMYMFPLNLTGYVYPGYDGTESVQERIDIVRGIDKPFILMKVLGAGRIPPEEGIPFVLQHSKPDDLISLGFGSEAEVVESIGWIERYS